MFSIDKQQKIAKAFILSLITGLLVLSLIGCGDSFRDSFASRSPGAGGGLGTATPTGSGSTSPTQLAGNISEASPPEVIQQLRQALEVYQPQVTILSPQADEVLQDDTVTARFQVQDLPIFKNPELDMGPHLHVILDNQPYIAVYDLNQPLVLPDLAPGTHTLRVFASRPWHESFKNEGAYSQTTFHIFTKTDDNNPDPAQPLLTYSRPKGSYGAEPILLDFYLTNAPLHLVAQENPKDEIADWRIRCTVNGSSFVLDRWEPLYLKGFKPGKNWVQIQFLDGQGNTVKNAFNNTARVITYDPKGKDTLSKLIRGELSADAARGIVDPNYTAKVPEVTPVPVPTPLPSPTPSPEPASPPPAVEEKAAETETTNLTETTTQKAEKPENQKPKGFFNRFRSPHTTPSPTLPEVMESPAPESTTPDITVPQPDTSSGLEPLATPEEKTTEEPKSPENQKVNGFFSRFRRPPTTPLPNLPEVIETPAPESIAPNIIVPQVENSPEPQPLRTPESQTVPEESTPLATPNSQFFKLLANQKPGGYFNRFRRPPATPSPELPPTLPEIVEPDAATVQPETSAEPK